MGDSQIVSEMIRHLAKVIFRLTEKRPEGFWRVLGCFYTFGTVV